MSTSVERLLNASRLAMPALGRADALFRGQSAKIAPSLTRERLDGKVKQGGPAKGGGGKTMSSALAARLKTKAPRGRGFVKRSDKTFAFDARQRAIVKTHYFSHAGKGGAALIAHGKYIARHAATRNDLGDAGAAVDEAPQIEERTAEKAHSDYLSRGGKEVYYDAQREGVDGRARLEQWAKSDLRHFRVILSAEEGARLRDLRAYTREVMARAEATLGTKLSWVAVDHHDTDNPHTHLVIRGRRANGQDLVLPRDFIQHGFRSIARDVATDWLGRRTPEHERRALEREVRRHGPTRLDAMIDGQRDKAGRIRVAKLEAPSKNADLTQALKARTRELERMGLARQVGRNVFELAPDWRERLSAMERHLDIRKQVVARHVEVARAQQQARDLRKGWMDR
jgi:type IV secretory pathway VirD2 relaxase